MLETLYVGPRRTYGKEPSDSERGNPMLQLHGLLFLIISRDRTYHGLCDTSYGALVGSANSSMCPLRGIDPTIYRTFSGLFTTELYLASVSPVNEMRNQQLRSERSIECMNELTNYPIEYYNDHLFTQGF